MRQQIQNGVISVRVPVATDQAKINEIVRNFQNWAALHNSSYDLKTALHQWGMDPIPFFKDSAVAQIVADVKSDLRRTKPSGAPESLLNARLFLEFAQEFDRQCHEVNRKLEDTESAIETVFNEVKGRGERLAETKARQPDRPAAAPGDYMIMRRLEAWTHLLLEDPVTPVFYVTSNRSIFVHLMGKYRTAEEIYHSGAPPVLQNGDTPMHVWQDNLLAMLARLAKTKWPSSTEALHDTPTATSPESKPSLSVHLIPDVTPLEFFAKRRSRTFSPAPRPSPSPSVLNTIIGFIES
jgi:hypothetical protein